MKTTAAVPKPFLDLLPHRATSDLVREIERNAQWLHDTKARGKGKGTKYADKLKVVVKELRNRLPKLADDEKVEVEAAISKAKAVLLGGDIRASAVRVPEMPRWSGIRYDGIAASLVEAAPYDGWKNLKTGKLAAPVELEDADGLWKAIADRIGHDPEKGVEMRAPIIGGRRRYHHRPLRSYHLSNDRTLTLTTDELEAKTWNNLKAKRHPAMPRIYDVFSVKKKGEKEAKLWAVVHEQLYWPIEENWNLFVDSFFKWRAMEREALSPAKSTDLEGFLRWVIDPEQADPKTTQKHRIEVVLPWKMTRQRRDDVADRRKKLFALPDLEAKIKWAKSALKYLHQNKVKFRDFDPSNLAMTKKGNRVVITNLAESRSIPTKTGRTGRVKGAAASTWYHTTSRKNLPSILREGLKINKPANYSQASSTYMKDVYGMVPVFLSKKSTPYDGDDDAVVLAVDVSGLSLAADIPSLADKGAYVEEDHIWFEEAPDGLDEEITFDDLINGPEAEAAINLTGTAAVLQDVEPSRISVLGDVSARKTDEQSMEKAIKFYGIIREAMKRPDIESLIQVTNHRGIRLPLASVTDDPELKNLTLVVHQGSDTFFREKGLEIVLSAKFPWMFSAAKPKKGFVNVVDSDVVKNSLIHELVHFVDFLRIKGWYKAVSDYPDQDKDFVKYANHPVEMNAYFQQSIADFVKEYKAVIEKIEDDTGPDNDGSADHQTAVWRLMDTAHEKLPQFMERWQSRFKPRVWESLSPENQKKMKARAYQLFDRITGDAKKRLKVLVDRGDPMSIL
jgi:serine/threonine protein kinase